MGQDISPALAQKHGREVAHHLKEDEGGATAELHREAHMLMRSSADTQNAFYSQLQETSKKHLNGMHIVGDVGEHNLKVIEDTGPKGHKQAHVLYDQAKTEKDEQTIRGKEQLADALRRQHPTWTHEQLLQEEGKIKQATGRDHFDAGERLQTNSDGSVTSRRESKQNFTEITSREGKVLTTKTHTERSQGGFIETTENKTDGTSSVRRQEKSGDYTLTNYDKDHKVSGSNVHKINADRTVTDTEFNAKGLAIGNRETKPDGSFNEQSISPKGTVYIQEQDAKGNFTLIGRDKDGDLVLERIHKKNADGSESETNKNADGSSSVRYTKADGSFTERTANADRSTAVQEEDKLGNYTRTNYDGNGRKLGDNVHRKNADGSETDTDHNGAGLAVWNRETRSDGSYSQQMLNPDRSLTMHEQDGAGNYTETTYDKDGTKIKEKAHHKGDPIVTDLRPVTDQSEVTKVVPDAVYIDSSNIDGGQGFRRDSNGQKEIQDYWLGRPTAEALMRAQSSLIQQGKEPIRLADMNAVGRTVSDRELIGKFAPGQPHAMKHSTHEDGVSIDVANWNNPDVVEALKREGFVHNVEGDRPHYQWFPKKD